MVLSRLGTPLAVSYLSIAIFFGYHETTFILSPNPNTTAGAE
jgi:hypothetical protein